MQRSVVIALASGLLVLTLIALYSELDKLRAESSEVDAGVAAFKDGDYQCAARMLRPFARRGDKRARLNLGLAYAYGLGVPRDRTKAAELLQDAADRKTADLYLWIAHTYETGDPKENISADANEATAWYQIAAAAGSDDARRHLYKSRHP
jgi:TPR repeat protein